MRRGKKEKKEEEEEEEEDALSLPLAGSLALAFVRKKRLSWLFVAEAAAHSVSWR